MRHISALAVAAAAACTDNPFASSRAAVASVSVSPPQVSVGVGSALLLEATVRDAEGTVLEDREVFWATDDSSVASVSGFGLVTGRAPGTAHILASSEGVDDIATVVVTGPRVAAVVVLPAGAETAVGSAVQLRAEAYDAGGDLLPAQPTSWASSDPAVARVDGAGLVTGVAKGRATITATVEGASGAALVTVQEPKHRGGGGGSGDDDDD